MRHAHIGKIFVALTGIVFVVIGCGTLQPTQSGFLKDYAFLNTSPKQGVYLDMKRAQAGKKYGKIIIDPVVVYLDDEAKGAGVEPEELKELANYFYIEIVSALKDDYQIVESPGHDVARLRVAITDVIANKPYLNIQLATKISKLGVGGAGIEAELLDATNSQRLFALSTRQKAKFKKLGDYGRGFEKWGNTELVFENWSVMIKEKIDAVNR